MGAEDWLRPEHLPALLVLALFVAGSLAVYVPLARRALVQRAGAAAGDWVDGWDAAIGGLLALWFAGLTLDMFVAEETRAVQFRDVVFGAVVYGIVVGGLLGALALRGRTPAQVFGLGREGFPAATGRALLYLAAAYPLLALVQLLVLRGGTEFQPQDVVEFLVQAESLRDRLAILIVAVVVAPIAEEVIFRGYLYPVGRRYFGPLFSLLGTSLLFAAIHGHLPAFGALFTLSVCLTLAYERSGSILVPMTMHAVFNAVSVAFLLFYG